MAAHVLLVEDDARLRALVREALASAGHRVTAVETGGEALAAVLGGDVDLLVLDLNLPDVDGIEVARRVHADGEVPILMLTARGGVASRVEGLYAGAADYLTKPFDVQELLARVHVRLRERKAGAEVVEYGDLRLLASTRTVARGGASATLPELEFELLRLLVANPGRVFSREDLEARLYGDDLPGSNTIEVFVYHLRRRLKQLGADDPIRTVRGKGYAVL